MINKWILNNFKSIEKEEDLKLEFRPLTIFTGANSSGKSTILQSILLVTQTLQSSIESRSIVLNGGIKKFGSYSDIVNKREYKRDLTLGFEFSDKEQTYTRYNSPWVDKIDKLFCQLSVGAKKDDDLRPYLKKLFLECNDGTGKSATLDVLRIDNPKPEVLAIVKKMKNPPEVEDLTYNIKVDVSDDFSRVHFDGDPFRNMVGASFTHFLPDSLIAFSNKFEKLADYVSVRYPRGYRTRFWNSLDDDERKVLARILEPAYKAMIENVLSGNWSNTSSRSARKRENFEEVQKRYDETGRFEYFLDMLDSSNLSTPEKERIVKGIQTELRNLEPIYETSLTPAMFIPGIELIKEFFSEHIWYLGPLREEPKALYPLESDGSITDVGYKGENTAAVFDFNRTRKIESVSPSSFDNIADITLKKKRISFEKAIKEWLVYLGVASDIDSDDKGKIGHTMQISNDLAMKQDLTHVGVGVSQVLPILVLSLLAKPGDVLIFEQPELHLHPKVQTRLADFFVAMNALGKQCLVETHSEYLINRLRYFVASSENSKVADDTMIYFVEKDGGHSNYRPVTINKYGVIEEWPEGFFDESTKIAEAILEAGMKKRMQELGIEE